jgi:uncharacterized protein (DUF2147 family)
LRLILWVLALVASASLAHAKEPSGLWWTEDHSGVIAISPCESGLCGRIVGQPDPVLPDGSLPRDWRGEPECGLAFLRVKASEDSELWVGTVLNPRNGTRWNCEISVDAEGNLRLRGYIFTSLLGETQIWTRFGGRVSEACEIS